MADGRDLRESLRRELEFILNDTCESKAEQSRVFFKFQNGSVEEYHRAIREASVHRDELQQSLTTYKAEMVALSDLLDDHSPMVYGPELPLILQLGSLRKRVESLRAKKANREKTLEQMKLQIEKLSIEMYGSYNDDAQPHSEPKLSLTNINNYENVLCVLKHEQRMRIQTVETSLETLICLCEVLSKNFTEYVELHPSTDGATPYMDISDAFIGFLRETIKALFKEAAQLLSDIQMGKHGDERSEKSLCRLKMTIRVIVLGKLTQLHDICAKSRVEVKPALSTESVTRLLNSGVDVSDMYETVDSEIKLVTQDFKSRQIVIEKADKWFAACEEERWLRDFSKEESCNSLDHGSHNRARQARQIVKELPDMMKELENLTTKWQKQAFFYRGGWLLKTIESYSTKKRKKKMEHFQIKLKAPRVLLVLVLFLALVGADAPEMKTPDAPTNDPTTQVRSKKAINEAIESYEASVSSCLYSLVKILKSESLAEDATLNKLQRQNAMVKRTPQSNQAVEQAIKFHAASISYSLRLLVHMIMLEASDTTFKNKELDTASLTQHESIEEQQRHKDEIKDMLQNHEVAIQNLQAEFNTATNKHQQAINNLTSKINNSTLQSIHNLRVVMLNRSNTLHEKSLNNLRVEMLNRSNTLHEESTPQSASGDPQQIQHTVSQETARGVLESIHGAARGVVPETARGVPESIHGLASHGEHHSATSQWRPVQTSHGKPGCHQRY